MNERVSPSSITQKAAGELFCKRRDISPPEARSGIYTDLIGRSELSCGKLIQQFKVCS